MLCINKHIVDVLRSIQLLKISVAAMSGKDSSCYRPTDDQVGQCCGLGRTFSIALYFLVAIDVSLPKVSVNFCNEPLSDSSFLRTGSIGRRTSPSITRSPLDVLPLIFITHT